MSLVVVKSSDFSVFRSPNEKIFVLLPTRDASSSYLTKHTPDQPKEVFALAKEGGRLC